MDDPQDTAEQNSDLLGESETSKRWAIFYKAYSLLWNCKWKEAEQTVKPHLLIDPWCGYIYFYVAFWRAVRINSQDHFEQAHMRCDKLQSFVETCIHSKTEAQLTELGLSKPQIAARAVELTILLAMICSWRGVLHVYRAANVKAGYNIRRSWKLFEEAREMIESGKKASLEFVMDPRVEGCLDFGIGIFQIGISLAPPDLQWLASNLGLTRKHNITELQRSIQSAGYTKNEAAIGLAVVHQYITLDTSKSIQIFDELMQSYPDSPLISINYGTFLKTQGDIKKAISVFENARMCSEGLPECGQLAAVSSYHLGHCFYLLCDWEKAVQQYEIFFKETTNNIFKAYAGLCQGHCYWMMTSSELRNDTLFLNKLIRIFRQVPQWKQQGDAHDEWAVKVTTRFLRLKKFDKWQEFLLLTLNYHEQKRFKEAWVAMEPAKQLLVEGPYRAANLWVVFLWFKGSCKRGMGDLTEAKYSFEKALHLEKKTTIDGTFGIVFSCIELAEIAFDISDLNEAKKFLTKAKSYSGYDWEASIQTRLHFLTERITEREEAKKLEAIPTATVELFKIDVTQAQPPVNTDSAVLNIVDLLPQFVSGEST